MKKARNTKIIATLGPSSSSKKIIETLFTQGVDVFRLNLSHGTHEIHKANYTFIREIEQKYNTPIGVLLDLQGPKLRIGSFQSGAITLKEGEPFQLRLDEAIGEQTGVTLPHPEIFKALIPNTILSLDDGKIQLKVKTCQKNIIETIVKVGGVLSDKKGVNIPGIQLPIRAITDKDKKDIEFGLSLGVDYIGLSFVQCKEDIEDARRLVHRKASLLAKIEKPMAIRNLHSIVEAADGVLIARGDLGVEMLPEEVPAAQKHMTHVCREMGKPVIVATHMLESMLANTTPTRAEVSDVANAVYDGVDSVMLSSETASGLHPIDSVRMMDRIIRHVEKDPSYFLGLQAKAPMPEATLSDAITTAAVKSASTIGAAAILSFTASGRTSLRVSRERPFSPIIGVTPYEFVARRLSLVWGVHPIIEQTIKTYAHMIQAAPEIAQQLKLAKKGSFLVITAGEPLGIAGGTNVLRVIEVD